MAEMSATGPWKMNLTEFSRDQMTNPVELLEELFSRGHGFSSRG